MNHHYSPVRQILFILFFICKNSGRKKWKDLTKLTQQQVSGEARALQEALWHYSCAFTSCCPGSVDKQWLIQRYKATYWQNLKYTPCPLDSLNNALSFWAHYSPPWVIDRISIQKYLSNDLLVHNSHLTL